MNKIFIAGQNGMVGSAIYRQLSKNEDLNLFSVSRSEVDFLNQSQTQEFFCDNKFDQIYLAAAKVGGIHANNEYPADFIYENLAIQSNIINGAHLAGVQKLLFLGSSCIYPKLAPQPLKENMLLTGPLEPTNESYAIAKIAGIKLCEGYNRQYNRDYRCVMPTNLYGPKDNFHIEDSHVIPALIRRFHDAKVNNTSQVIAWGSGKPRREFLHVDDMAKGSIHVMNISKETYNINTKPMLSHINIGSGIDCSIYELTKTIAKVIDFNGEIIWDKTRPDGTPQKLMDVSVVNKLGWKSSINLYDGLINTYNWFLENQDFIRS